MCCLLMQLSASALIALAGIVGIAWAYSQFYLISRIEIISQPSGGEGQPLMSEGADDAVRTARLKEIYTAIWEGAESFLRAEYTVCFWFIMVFSIIILVLVSWGTGWDFYRGSFTAISFLLGAATSMASGYLGMKVAVYSNVRTTVSAQKPGWTECFNTAFRAEPSWALPSALWVSSCFTLPCWSFACITRTLRNGFTSRNLLQATVWVVPLLPCLDVSVVASTPRPPMLEPISSERWSTESLRTTRATLPPCK